MIGPAGPSPVIRHDRPMSAAPSGASSLEIFSTCPQSKDGTSSDYARRVVEVARWSEAAGCAGILVYTDNSIVDPWLVAQIILQNTERLCPLIAVQPIYMHPYAAAKMVASYAFMYRRRVYLNMVAGGFRGDLFALNDPTHHDDRYERVREYALIVKHLLESPDPVTFEGRFYTVRNLRMTPPLSRDLMPGMLMSGSSPAGLATAEAIGATSVIYPRPAEEEGADGETRVRRGARIGVIARPDAGAAWRVAHERFPDDRRGRAMHRIAMTASDSTWHRQLSEKSEDAGCEDSPYWLWPFQTYRGFCPYIVGSFDQAADYLAHYIAKGYRTYILDIPHSSEDLECASIAFSAALSRTGQQETDRSSIC